MNKAYPAPGSTRRLSEILAEIAGGTPERLSLGEIVERIGDRGHGLLIALLALPNMLPIFLPGMSAVFILPLVFVALQLTFGRRRLWTPAILTRRSVPRPTFGRMVSAAMPYLARMERILKPRLAVLTGPAVERWVGALCVVLGLLLSLPIPLTNIPLAFPIVLLGIGIAEHDGLVVGIGAIIGVLATAGVLTFAGAIILGLLRWAEGAIGI